MELTILIPARNEEQTIRNCIKKAKQFLVNEKIEGEIVVVNNASSDNTAIIAKQEGVNVVHVKEKGYGITLIEGSKKAKGTYTIIGDADDSYNFLEAKEFINRLRKGSDLVIGNRFKGKIEKGAMKFTHRYVGTPILTWIVRKKYHVPVGDINCGMRGYRTEKINHLKCKSKGMEYATEMIIKAKKEELIIDEIPINFYKDKREKKSHLRTIRDGIRHLKLIVSIRK